MIRSPKPKVLPLVLAMVLAANCSGSGDDDLLDAADATPLFSALETEAGRIFGVAASVGESPDDEPDPTVPERLGAIAEQIVDMVKPPEAASALKIIEEALTARLTKAGGRPSGKHSITLRDVIVRLAPDAPRKLASELEDADNPPEARESLRSAIEAGLAQLIFASLLADPAAQARLAPRLSPDDFPPAIPTQSGGDVDPLLGGIESIKQWRDGFFDRDTLTVPQPNDDGFGWDLFRAWAWYVNPDLDETAGQILDDFQGHFLSGRHRHPIDLE